MLFVSHNLGAVTQLCSRGIVLQQGRTVFDGEVAAGLFTYVDGLRNASSTVTFIDEPEKDMQILSMSVVAQDGEVIEPQPHTEPCSILLKYRMLNGPRERTSVWTDAGPDIRCAAAGRSMLRRIPCARSRAGGHDPV